MQCARCGTPFEGRFCPACGAAAPPVVQAPTIAAGWPCPRCGTTYVGNFCPRCGLPALAMYGVPYRSMAGRSILSVLWTIAIAGFLILLALDFAGLFLAPGLIVPMVPGIRQGATSNPDLDLNAAGWTFLTRSPSAEGNYTAPVAGDGYLRMTDTTYPGTLPIGFWWQSFDVSGSRPFIAAITLEVRVALGSTATGGILYVFVTPSLQIPALSDAVGSVAYPGDTDWTPTPRFLAETQIGGPGTFYFLVGFYTTAADVGSPTVVSLDEIRLRWTTDAAVVFYLPLPEPTRVFLTQDPNAFLAYYGFVVVAIVAAAAYHAVGDRKAVFAAIAAPLGAVGRRLRSGSAWLAVAQVFLAFTFFQFMVIWILTSINQPPESPFTPTAENAWVILYELANASVYEEFAFRVLTLGAPLAIGSLVLRALEVNRGGGAWRGGTTPGRHLAGALRFLGGGNVRASSSKETLLAAWAFLVGSAFLFGLAHVPGWGLWKFLPAFVAGLGFGYLFLRYGVTAAILAHFVNDYAFSLTYMGVGGFGLELFSLLLDLGLVAAGSGFFAWYVLRAWKGLGDLWRRFVRTPQAARVLAPRAAYPMPGAPTGPAPVPVLRDPPQAVYVPRDPRALPAEYVPTYRPPPYGYPPVRFQCPSCGWIEARYDAGRFTCVRCGQTA